MRSGARSAAPGNRALAVIACAAALAAGVLAGCGAGHGATSARTTTAIASGATGTAPTTGTSAPAPVTTTTATTGTGTTAQVLPGTGRPAVVVGDMNTPEQFVLGELYQLALSAQGYTITTTRNIGTTQISQEALLQGSLDLYPQYLNVWDASVVGDHHTIRTFAAAYRIGQRYANRHGMDLLTPTGFSDTAGIAVTTAYAEVYGLRTLGDLRRVDPTLILGAPLPFSQSTSGLPALERAYDFTPATTAPLAIGSQYAELRHGTVDAAYVNTSDGQLSEPTFRLLADPKHILGFGNVVPVTTQAVLAAEGPAFAATVNQVSALLTTSAMRGLNAEVSVAHDNPTEVAREFLQGNGILPAPTVSAAG